MSLQRFLEINPVDNFDGYYSRYITDNSFFGFPLEPILKAEDALLNKDLTSIAYFSMEYGLAPSIYNTFPEKGELPEANMFRRHDVFSNMRGLDYFLDIRLDKMLDLPIYSGGLGVLAGDTVKNMADLGMSVVAIGILWNKGYFKQNFWFRYGQLPEEMHWDPWHYPGLIPLNKTIKLDMRNDTLYLKLWKYYVYSYDKRFVVPLILLDANIDANIKDLQRLTDQLYRSDNPWWKIYQRVILGLGGMRALENFQYGIAKYHLNEGHAAFAFLEKVRGKDGKEIEDEKKNFVYTCHTPVEAGHDRFHINDLRLVLKDEDISMLKQLGSEESHPDMINLTLVAMNASTHINAVAQKHCWVMHNQFPAYKDRIIAVTNGIHTLTWVSEPFRNLFNKYREAIGDWEKDPTCLKNVSSLRNNQEFRSDLWNAHQENKRQLIGLLWRWGLNENTFTLAWARRIAAYKRPSLILRKPERLVDIARKYGRIQILMAGKAHPQDNLGFTFIRELMDKIDALYEYRQYIRIAMLENYDTYFGKLLTNTVDVWLNNPLPPFEASGTSGMKAILNGVLQLTTLDGWVVEAEDKDIGWIFGYRDETNDASNELNLRLDEDADALYDTLEQVVQLYYSTNKAGNVDVNSPWIDKMINAVCEASFFNTYRMVYDYLNRIWEVDKAFATA